MNYVILAAGMGSRLHPFTKITPKCLFMINERETAIERTIKLIEQYDMDSDICVVLGFCKDIIESKINNISNKVRIIENPFYGITNSIASVWFAKKQFLKGKQTAIINADIIAEKSLMKLITEIDKKKSYALIDSSIRSDGDYNAVLKDGKVVTMGKSLSEYDAEYFGAAVFSAEDSVKYAQKVNEMVSLGVYDCWYEDAIVQMIFSDGFEIFGYDVAGYTWSEIDVPDDLLKVRNICNETP